jgi:hypothetical protein
MNMQQKARSLMSRRQQSSKNRQQSMLERLNEQIGQKDLNDLR